VFECVFLLRRIVDGGHSPKNPVSLGVMHHRQNPLDSTASDTEEIFCKLYHETNIHKRLKYSYLLRFLLTFPVGTVH
jgi:hypothetical protein